MNPKLAEIIIQAIEFLGLATDSEINPDAAVRQLEIMSSLLKELSETELADFFAQVERRLEKLMKDGAPKEQVDFLKNIREFLGVGLLS